MSIGSFSNINEANNVEKYIKTKFVRTLLDINKTTPVNPVSTWKFIPLQDFTPDSDIDWSKSISKIDQQLYKKYNLLKDEVNFIESKVQKMD